MIRLLARKPGIDEFELVPFYTNNLPPYAILSHTWTEGQEVTYDELLAGTGRDKTGFAKIRFCADRAAHDGLRYFWVDTCCINKSSSAELTEAINSMYQWYKNSRICYAYLTDVFKAQFAEEFGRSRWFSRGWTLQELLAPDNVVFYDHEWQILGTKSHLVSLISAFTGIDELAILSGRRLPNGDEAGLDRFCAAKRMSWASGRTTTRVEDMAYCLLGIFNINMPLLYGEGERAFIRLQEEIIRGQDDDSILAWGLDTERWDSSGFVHEAVSDAGCGLATYSNILASSPEDFKDCQRLEYAAASRTPFMITNSGLQIELPLVAFANPESYPDNVIFPVWIGLLSCSSGIAAKFLGIVLTSDSADRQSLAGAQRAIYGSHRDKTTVLVGARAAAQAIRSRVTITRGSTSQTIRDYHFGFRQFIVNESQALLDIGYGVVHASAETGQGTPGTYHYPGEWDPIAKVFTVGGRNFETDIIRFMFRCQRGSSDSNFSVFIRGSRAVVRGGSTFSVPEQTALYRHLPHSHLHGDESAILPGRDGSRHMIIVTIRESYVAVSQIFEVNVSLELESNG